MKSISLNPFPVTDLQPEVELMHLLYACADIIVTFATDGIGQTPSSLERYLVIRIIQRVRQKCTSFYTVSQKTSTFLFFK